MTRARRRPCSRPLTAPSGWSARCRRSCCAPCRPLRASPQPGDWGVLLTWHTCCCAAALVLAADGCCWPPSMSQEDDQADSSRVTVEVKLCVFDRRKDAMDECEYVDRVWHEVPVASACASVCAYMMLSSLTGLRLAIGRTHCIPPAPHCLPVCVQVCG